MSRFDETFKDEVRAKNDIVEVISSYVKLERRGNRYVGLCPFHGEKTPSFHVIPDLQIYHCFGCKASGDVYKFLQEREHLTFYEALVQLARRARIPLPKEERTPEEEKAYQQRRGLYDALELATRFYHDQLFQEAGKPGLDYLYGRGLTEETIRRFRLGWAPGYGRLLRTLRGRFGTEIPQQAGLILPRREGEGFMDVFYERVMFPITDLSGRPIGFGGRILEGSGAKYKNTAETSLFTKRHVLFGLSQAKEAMRARNQAILVEGYMDVIMPHQWGLRNVVAPLGTALTDEQCRLLRQQAEQVIVGFDADVAGQMATLRGLEKLYEIGCDVRILQIPDGKDPDEFIRAHGIQAFEQCVANAVPLIEFKVRRALEASKGTGSKAKAVDAVARVLADLKSDVLREEYVHRVANELADNPLDVRELKLAIDRQMNRSLGAQPGHISSPDRHNKVDLGAVRPGAGPVPHGPARFAPPTPQQQLPATKPVTEEEGALLAERTLLSLLLHHPPLLRVVEAALGSVPFAEPVHQTILASLRELLTGPHAGSAVIARLLDRLADDEARVVVTEIGAKPPVSVDPEKEASDCIEKIKKHRDSRRLDDLHNQIKAAQASGQRVDAAILREYTELLAKRKTARP